MCSQIWGKIVNITLNGEIVLSGVRTDRLWYIANIPVVPAQSFDLPVDNATIPKIIDYANLLASTNTLANRVNFL